MFVDGRLWLIIILLFVLLTSNPEKPIWVLSLSCCIRMLVVSFVEDDEVITLCRKKASSLSVWDILLMLTEWENILDLLRLSSSLVQSKYSAKFDWLLGVIRCFNGFISCTFVYSIVGLVYIVIEAYISCSMINVPFRFNLYNFKFRCVKPII